MTIAVIALSVALASLVGFTIYQHNSLRVALKDCDELAKNHLEDQAMIAKTLYQLNTEQQETAQLRLIISNKDARISREQEARHRVEEQRDHLLFAIAEGGNPAAVASAINSVLSRLPKTEDGS